MAQDDTHTKELELLRGKYYESLAQLERKEKEWRRVENVLRQCISRLTLAADTSDAALTEQLDRLREAIRKNYSNTEVEKLIQALSEHLVRLDQKRRETNRTPNPGQLLIRLAEGIPFPHGMGRKTKAFTKAVAALPAEADYGAQVKELVALVSEALQWAEGEAETTGGGGKGLLRKLFQREEKAASAEEAVAPAPAATATPAAAVPPPPEGGLTLARDLLNQVIGAVVTPQRQEAAGLHARLEVARHEDELRAVGRQLAALVANPGGPEAPAVVPGSDDLSPQETLLQLLERLSVPGELAEQVEAIKGVLGGGELKRRELEKVLGQIADLITAMRTRVQNEKAEIENFLKQLTENLKELDLNLQNVAAAHRETVTDGRKLDADIKVQVKGIEDSVQQAQHLEQLKQTVQERVETIRRHMDVFRRVEDERIEKAEQEVTRLTKRLQDLERETDALRSRIQDERNQALIDPLTEIHNRLAYNERIQQEYTRWKRYLAPLIFTVWDVDYFKKINDTYGHQAGDKVLKVVARLLSSHIRETDFVARYGGEEFVILLPETPLENAHAVAEKVRSAIEQCEFHYRGERVQITISCGVAKFRTGDTPDSVFARADAALYRAKAAGRNRCVVDGEGGEQQ